MVVRLRSGLSLRESNARSVLSSGFFQEKRKRLTTSSAAPQNPYCFGSQEAFNTDEYQVVLVIGRKQKARA